MKVSVLIPTYNSSATIRMTLESVLRQSLSPHEILVLDDGSTDDTVSILHSYGPRVTVLQRKNGGVASARNELCAKATGDLLAFLDHDDLWHPRYLEAQSEQLLAHPEAVGLFAGHADFFGYGAYEWKDERPDTRVHTELMAPLKFFRAFTTAAGVFGSASFFCMPKSVLSRIDGEPFASTVSGVDDCYIKGLLTLLGPVIYCSVPLVAYRIIKAGQSTDKVKACALCVDVFGLLEPHFQNQADAGLQRAFGVAFASERRSYAKRLMGVGRVEEARRQLSSSLRNSSHPTSIAKSLGLLFFSCLPRPLQPAWPPAERAAEIPEGAQRA